MNETDKLTQEEIDQLMAAYRATGDREIRNQLVMHYSYIARAVAVQLRGIASSYAQLEDVVNQGVITLIDCVDRFDPSKEIKFESYAFMRVRGAVIDFVRKQDWVPRRVRMAAKDIAAAREALQGELLREPTQEELAGRLGMDVETLDRYYGEISNLVMLSFESLIQNVNQMGDALEPEADEDRQGPETRLFKSELKETLKDAIEGLSEREQLVINLYYYEHLKLAEIAKILQVSEQRVSQINAKALVKLRSRLEPYMKG